MPNPLRRRSARWLLPLALAFIALLVVQLASPTAHVVRGKSAAVGQPDGLNESQALAQSLALQHPEVTSLSAGTRTEVFQITPVTSEYTEAAQSCATDECWQVNLYNFDENAAITVLVNIDQDRVVDVLWQPSTRPYIPQRLADRALEIALEAPEVAQVIGDLPAQADWAPMHASLVDSVCERDRLCVASVFDLGGYLLWAFVDLQEEEFVGLSWTSVEEPVSESARGADYSDRAEGCPVPGSVNQDGWHVDYAVTSSDGFAVTNVSFEGHDVLTRAKAVQWNVDYGTSGFEDSPGCGSGGGGFPIQPYGNTVLEQINGGFELIQDFRMSNWGNSCNYRYEQRYQFYEDGRFRVVAAAFGKGCGDNGIYRPLIRIDMAVDGDDGDSVTRWDGGGWVPITTESVMPSLAGPGDPNPVSPEGYGWQISDSEGMGYFIEPGRGQFGDGGRGDNEYFYVVKHYPNQGDTDMGLIGDCCSPPYHGPEQYVNGENVEDTNVVLWYVSQSQTDTTMGSEYCWTVSGEPFPETYPCFTGPMFVPFAENSAGSLYIPYVANGE